MDREGTSPPIYTNKNHFDTMWDYIGAKMDAHIELIKNMLNKCKSSTSSTSSS